MQKIILFLFLILIYQAGSQSLHVFDVDTTDYPIMRAKFYVFDSDGKQISDLQPSDFEVTENDEPREVLNISCPTPQPPTAISSVLTIDVSGSMYGNSIEMAKEAAKSWVNSLPLGKSECAITSFTLTNQYIQDFTTDRTRLFDRINALTVGGGTDFNAAFVNPIAGGLLALEKAKYKKVMVLITDGYASGNENQILSKAQSIGATVYCVTLGYTCPDILKTVAEETGGKWFEDVTTVAQAIEVYSNILIHAQNSEPCEIEWESEYNCTLDRLLKVKFLPTNTTETIHYAITRENALRLNISLLAIKFYDVEPNITTDTIITVTAINNHITITDITSSDSSFSVSPKSFDLKKGESKEITLTLCPKEKKNLFSKIEIISTTCTYNLYASNSYLGTTENMQTLTVLHPNGGEIFLAGSDTVITWKGILPNEYVKVDFSSDNGHSWTDISDTANNYSESWHIQKNIKSHECLLSITYDKKADDCAAYIDWTKFYGGTRFDGAHSVQQTNDGGYIVVGQTESYNGDVDDVGGGDIRHHQEDIWILKLDMQGVIEWTKYIGGNLKDYSNNVIQTRDGGFVVVGHTNSTDGDIKQNHGLNDALIVKLNAVGNIEWIKNYGGNRDDFIFSINQTIDGGYIAAGVTESNNHDISDHIGQRDAWIIKLNSDGEMQWNKCYGGSNNEVFYSIYEAEDGSYIAAGYTSSDAKFIKGRKGAGDVWVVKIDPNGEMQWNNCYGGSNDEQANQILHTLDGGYIFVGTTQSDDFDVVGYHDDLRNHIYSDIWIVKLKDNGTIQWSICYGGSQDDYASSIVQAQDQSYIISASSSSYNGDFKDVKYNNGNGVILKIDNNGKIQWKGIFGGNNSDVFSSIKQTYDGGFIVVGSTNSNDGDASNNPEYRTSDLWVIKLKHLDEYNQSDTSDAVFSIVAPEVSSQDINMGDVVVNSSKDSVITAFLDNIGQWNCRIDSIYFEGADAAYFGLNGPNPVYSVSVGEKQMSEFKFSPTEVRDYAAQVVVITQADTLKQNIYGRGVEMQIAANAEIIDFGIHELYDYADSTVALIQNVTPNPIQITKIEMLGPDKEQFIFNDLTQIQAFTLAVNTDYSLNLRFNPKYIGRTSGQVAFHFNGAGSPAIAQLYGAGIGAELSASTDTAYVGDVIGIDISFDNNDIAKFAEVIGSFEGVVRVESSILGTLHKENLVEIKADSAYIKFKGEINSASNIIATIPLKVALGRVESTSIDFDYVKWFDTEGNEIVYDTEFSSGFFKQLGICEDGGKRFFNPDGIVGISNLSPNPAENRIQIDFSVIEAGYTEITLVNMLGQTVATLFAEDISYFQDRQIIQDISEIGSGQYILQFKTPTYVERRKVMVVR